MRPSKWPRNLMRPRGHGRWSIIWGRCTSAHYSIIITTSAPIIGTWASPASMRFRLKFRGTSVLRRLGTQTSILSDIVDQAGVVKATSMVMRRLRHLASQFKTFIFLTEWCTEKHIFTVLLLLIYYSPSLTFFFTTSTVAKTRARQRKGARFARQWS